MIYHMIPWTTVADMTILSTVFYIQEPTSLYGLAHWKHKLTTFQSLHHHHHPINITLLFEIQAIPSTPLKYTLFSSTHKQTQTILGILKRIRYGISSHSLC